MGVHIVKWCILIASILICGGLVFLGLSNRYYIGTSTRLKIDRLTGKTYEVRTPMPAQTYMPHKWTEEDFE
jgi:hypothetical protein